MKKLLIAIFAGVIMLSLAACSNNNTNDEPVITEELLGSEESLATLSYLSTGFLDFSTPTVSTDEFSYLAASTSSGWTEFENEIDTVNVYFDRLKALIDNGVNDFGSVTEEVSDNELYEYKLTFTVNEEVYVIYYSIDAETGDMTGIIVIGDIEYVFEVQDNMKSYEYTEEEKELNEGDTENTEQNTNDDEHDDAINEDGSETKMTLIAYSGDDYIRIMYKTEEEDGESTIKFDMTEYIAGVENEVSLKISQEDNETKIDIEDGEDSYSFKQEVEDGETVYKLNYRIDGTVGMVTIKVITDEEGNVTYTYKIVEAGQEKNVEKQEPKSPGFDDDEPEEETENTEA